MMKKHLVGFALLCLWPVWLPAQQNPVDAAGQRAEMKKVDWLVGNWSGAGWIVMGPGGPKEFTQTEKIEMRLDGLVLIVEGEGKSKETGATTHRALAFLSYDEKEKVFRWRTFTADGRGADTVAKVEPGRLEWGLDVPGRGKIRYIIVQNEKGEWFEIGERSRDGGEWQKFFEMTLQRAK